MPDLPIDPTELLRTLDRLRAALIFGSAAGRADEAIAAAHRLTDELARLNGNIERALPVVESLERSLARSAGVVGSMQGLGAVLRGFAPRPGDARPDAAGEPAGEGPPDPPASPPDPLR